MKFCTCPRCGFKSLDRLKSFSVCYNCNYNSVEGFSWSSKNDHQYKRKAKIQKEGK